MRAEVYWTPNNTKFNNGELISIDWQLKSSNGKSFIAEALRNNASKAASLMSKPKPTLEQSKSMFSSGEDVFRYNEHYGSTYLYFLSE